MKFHFPLVLATILLSFFCSHLVARDYVRSLKTPPKFTGIECYDAFIVNIHKGKTYEAKVYGSEDDVKKVILRVVNQNLQIKYTHTPFIGLKSDRVLRVEVTLPVLESLSMIGSGSLVSKDKFDSAKLSLSLAGSGLISLASVNNNQTSIQISGSGTLQLTGYASKMDLSLAGSGLFSGEKFTVDDADVTVAGSGEATVFASRILEATVSGSGSIYYLGKPTVNRVITGSGDIAPLKTGN